MKVTSEVYENGRGEIAVLVSPGWGAGWSTWERPELAYDKFVVELFLEYQEGKVSEEEVEKKLEKRYNKSIYMGGWSDLVIEWMPRGEPFQIIEYDGSEYINREFLEF